jgi:hypothetical protein
MSSRRHLRNHSNPALSYSNPHLCFRPQRNTYHFQPKNGLIPGLEISRHCPPLDSSCATHHIHITFGVLLCSIPSKTTFKQPTLDCKLDCKSRRNVGFLGRSTTRFLESAFVDQSRSDTLTFNIHLSSTRLLNGVNASLIESSLKKPRCVS